MKKIILILLLANFIACRQKTSTTTERETDFTTQQELSNPPKEISFDDLEEILLPFCMKSQRKTNGYYSEIDTFLLSHKLKKSLDKEINALFHKGTIDFVADSLLIAYPYFQEREDSPPFAIKKMQINDNITAVLYAYIKISDLLVPRIELQTFDKQGNYIDSLIIFYEFVYECSGNRFFCIDNNFLIKLNTVFACAPEMNEGENLLLEWEDVFKITETGKIVKQ